MKLSLWHQPLIVCRLDGEAKVPDWIPDNGMVSVTRTPDELSIVCTANGEVPPGIAVEGPWRALVVEGPIAFSEIGVLSGLAAPLAEAGISLFAISTYDTDWILVPETKVEPARRALLEAGHILD